MKKEFVVTYYNGNSINIVYVKENFTYNFICTNDFKMHEYYVPRKQYSQYMEYAQSAEEFARKWIEYNKDWVS